MRVSHVFLIAVMIAAVFAVSGCGGKKAPVMGEIAPGKFVLVYSWEEGDEFEMTKVRKDRS